MTSSSKFIWIFCSICKCLQCQPDFIEPWWAPQRKDEHVLSLTWLRLETSCTAKHASWTSVSSTKAGWHLHWLARKKIGFEQNGSKWQVSTNDFTFSMRDSCLRFETPRCCWLLEIISCKCLWLALFSLKIEDDCHCTQCGYPTLQRAPSCFDGFQVWMGKCNFLQLKLFALAARCCGHTVVTLWNV